MSRFEGLTNQEVHHLQQCIDYSLNFAPIPKEFKELLTALREELLKTAFARKAKK